MTKQAAVASTSLLVSSGRVKQTALLFDSIAVFGLGTWLWDTEGRARQGDAAAHLQISEMEYLRTRGLIDDPDPRYTAGFLESVKPSRLSRNDTSMDDTRDDELDPEITKLLIDNQDQPLADVGQLWQRIYAIAHRKATGIDTVVVGDPRLQEIAQRKPMVCSVVLKSLPLPDDTTPWEAVFDFRNDPTARGHILALKRWMNAIANDDKLHNEAEVSEELEYLLNEYDAYMKLKRARFTTGTLETLFVTAGDVLEHLVRLRFSSAAKALFSIRERELDLLEAERDAPGRDLIYISETRRKFAR